MTFYTSLTGLNNAQSDLDMISQNIANANTLGFKKSTASFSDIVSSSVLTDPSLTIGIGARLNSIKQQFSLGSMEQTGNSLDLAINGDGFFVMKNPLSNQIQYTRAGSFAADTSGYVKNDQGNRVQVFPTDATGTATSTTPQDCQIPLTNSAGANYSGVTVTTAGKLLASYSDGSTAYVGILALASFADDSGLKQMGNASWTATGLSGAATLAQPGSSSSSMGTILSGTLEQSNVDLSSELVSLINAQRNFQANSKAIDTFTQIGSTIMNLRVG